MIDDQQGHEQMTPSTNPGFGIGETPSSLDSRATAHPAQLRGLVEKPNAIAWLDAATDPFRRTVIFGRFASAALIAEKTYTSSPIEDRPT